MTENINLVGSLCVDQANFTLFRTDFLSDSENFLADITQTQAIEECNLIDSTLGPIFNFSELETIAQFVRDDADVFRFDPEADRHEISFYIGIESPINHNNDPRNFQFVSDVDESFEDAIEFYHVNRGEPPWSGISPDQNTSLCGQLLFFNNIALKVDGQVDDVTCFGSHGFICRSRSPCLIQLELPEKQDKGLLATLIICGIIVLGLLLVLALFIHFKISKRLEKVSLKCLELSKLENDLFAF